MCSLATCKNLIVYHLFSFFFSAANACLIPFLSLYMLFLGMNPFQTGLLLGLKGLTASLSSLFWAQCVTNSSRRLKCVLVFSLIFFVSSHIIMVLMPIMNNKNIESFCLSPPNSFVDNKNLSLDDFNKTNPLKTSLYTTHLEAIHVSTTTAMYKKAFTDKPSKENSSSSSPMSFLYSSTPPSSSTSSTTSTLPISSWNNATTSATRKTLSTTMVNTMFNDPIFGGSETEQNDEKEDKHNDSNAMKRSVAESHNIKKSKPHTTTSELQTTSQQITTPQQQITIPPEQKTTKPQQITTKTTSTPKQQSPTSLLDNSYLTSFQNLQSIQGQLFGAMIVLIVVSEIFSSPCKQTADELHVESLEPTENMLVRRRSLENWYLFASCTTPWLVSLLIDHLPCRPFHFHKILLHFVAFAFIHLFTILASLCLPVRRRTTENSLRSKVSRTKGSLRCGLMHICSDGRTMVCGLTVLLMGVVQGSVATFLPWKLHQVIPGSYELFIGLSITVVTLAELLSYLLGKWLSSKIGHVTSIFGGMLVNAARVLAYALVSNPWLILAAESLHLFGGGLVFVAISNHPVFQTIYANKVVMRRKKKKKLYEKTTEACEVSSILLTLNLLRVGLGSAIGCMLSGLALQHYNFKILFVSCSILTVAWTVMFLFLYPCCKRYCSSRINQPAKLAGSLMRRKNNRHKKLLDEDDEDDDEDNDDDDDEGGYVVDDDDDSEDGWLVTVTRKQ